MILSTITDLLFPKFNSNYTTFNSYLSEKDLNDCVSFYKSLDYFDKSLKVLVCDKNSNTNVLRLIEQAKYNGELAIAKDLARLAFKTTTKNLPTPQVITFVPADSKRFRKRGYHLPELVSTYLAEKSNTSLIQLTKKQQHTQSQVGMDKNKRLSNLENAFTLNDINTNNSPALNFSGVIWLIDDIVTTGATLFFNYHLIKKAYPQSKIEMIAIAGEK